MIFLSHFQCHQKEGLSVLCALLILLLSLVPQRGRASSEVLTGVQLASCNNKFCTRLDIRKAERSPLDSIYVFDSARMKITDQEGKGASSPKSFKTELAGTEGYYDPDSGRIVLKGIKGRKFSELVFDLNTGDSTYF